MKRKRIVSLLLSAVLMFGIVSSAQLGEGEPTTPVITPNVTVISSNIGNEFLELGLSIDAGTDGTFRSVGAVLEYNTTALEPCDWSTDGVKTSLDGAANWNTAVPLPTKGPDNLSGKTALGYVEAEKGYLYLSAEAPKGIGLAQVLGGEPIGDADKPNTPNGLTNTTLNEASAPAKQVVIVRFRYKEKTPAKPADGENPPVPAVLYGIADAGIDIVGTAGDIAKNSPVGSQMEYFAGAALTATPIAGIKATLLTIQTGQTANTGGSAGPADTSDFFPIIFYDWDGSTLLGSTIAPKVEDKIEQQAIIDEIISTKAAELSATEGELAGGLWVDDATKPLTYKKGYTFGKWIPYDAKDNQGNEVYTNYGKAVAVKDGGSVVELPEPASYAFTEADYAGLSLKAAYATNADIDTLANSMTERTYTVSLESYLQFGTSNDVGITVSVKRENQEGKGVHRVREPGLRIAMQMAGGTVVFAQQALDNRDAVTTTIAVNGAVQTVTAEVVDLCAINAMGGTANWAAESVGRSNKATQVPGGGKDTPGFVLLGAVGLINDGVKMALEMGDTGEKIRTNTSTSGVTALVAASHYTKADLDITTVANSPSTGAAARRRAALANIFDRYEAEGRPLTHEEMQDAITNGTKTP